MIQIIATVEYAVEQNGKSYDVVTFKHEDGYPGQCVVAVHHVPGEDECEVMIKRTGIGIYRDQLLGAADTVIANDGTWRMTLNDDATYSMKQIYSEE